MFRSSNQARNSPLPYALSDPRLRTRRRTALSLVRAYVERLTSLAEIVPLRHSTPRMMQLAVVDQIVIVIGRKLPSHLLAQ